MSAINELRETLEHTQTASFVTTMLRDISATKLQSIRSAFDANHAYYLELHQLMALVQAYSTRYAEAHDIEITPQKIYVALTSNKRFYGTLNHQVIRSLREVIRDDPQADFVVMGQTGRQIVDLSPLETNRVRFSAFLQDEPTSKEMFDFIKELAPYTEIIIIHPTFVNSFTQHPASTDLTHVPDEKELDTTLSVDYIFEPEITEMIEFFTTQIRLVLFSRVILETQLALTGARLMKMQRARERAEELLQTQRRVIHKEITTVQSMRLLETFAGFKSKDSAL